MLSSSKILTVSYGTFSCTLEGFEESFETMKAIAEYFRDLAADDRYFGAEPPVPDAEMLARIAEREISRRVEARMQDGGIVLRASDSAAHAGLALGGAAEASDEAEAREAADAEDAARAEEEAKATEDAARAEEDAKAAEDAARAEDEVKAAEVAARAEEEAKAAEDAAHAEEEAKAAEDAARAEEDAKAAEDAARAEEEAKAAESKSEEDSLAAALSALDFDQDADPAIRDTDSDTVADTGANENANQDEDDASLSALANLLKDEETKDAAPHDTQGIQPEATVAPRPAPAPNSVAAKLQRIRAVVSSTRAQAAGNYTEDEHADDIIEDERDVMHDTGLEAEDAARDDNLFHDTLAAEDTPEAPQPTEADGDTSKAPLRHARVLKIKRATFDAAVARGQLEEIDEDEGDTGGLSAEEEDDLARELAALQAEAESQATFEEPQRISGEETAEDLADAMLAADDDATDNGATGDAADGETDDALHDDAQGDTRDDTAFVDLARKAIRMGSDGRAMLTGTGTDEPSVSRLMDTTQNHLDEPEGNRRRNAIQHLRAAVAATKADKAAGTDDKPRDTTMPYRDDLAEVVRPRRPQAASSRSERPVTDAAPAPLKLVAEQRVDLPGSGDAADTAPVRPRRVAADRGPRPVSSETIDSGFAEFAGDMGATSLPDLLEAAAAYMSFVEGRDQFSRPQLMSKVREVETAESTREDRLRSFGQLLREGKIEKLRGGRFTASDRISYRPEAKSA